MLRRDAGSIASALNQSSINRRQKLVAVVGPTASGKTALGVEVARRFHGEVVNSDSRLFYQGMDVGTAKPSPEERRGVPHHLIDFLDPGDWYSLKDFLGAARESIADINAMSRLPVVVGGSGQYVWGLLEGWNVPSIPPNPALRAELECILNEEGIGALQERLRLTNARDIERVEMQNPRRLIRAIERAVATGDAMGGASKSRVPPYNALVLGLKLGREELHRRVARRIHRMLASGWRAEVEHLIARGVERDLPSMSAIGYRQLYDHIEGRIFEGEMVEETIAATLRLIGAQNNWFKPGDKRITWLDASEPSVFDDAASAVNDWMGITSST